MTIGNLIFRTTGIMTRKTIMRNCSKVGEQISDCVAKNGYISPENISEIISGVLGKRANKINVAYDRESIVKAIQENFNLSEAEARAKARVTRAVSVPRLLGKRTALIVPQSSKSIDNVNLVPHELEHALMQTFKLSSKVKNKFIDLFKKLPEKKFNTEKFSNELGNIDAKGLRLQGRLLNGLSRLGQTGIIDVPATSEGLLKQCNCKSVEELRQKIREILYTKEILSTENDLLNVGILNLLKTSIKDESFAYKIGGLSERKYNELLGLNLEGKSSKSELVSLLYKEAYKVLSKEQRHALMNSIKSKLGIKVNRKFELECLEKQKKIREGEFKKSDEKIIYSKEKALELLSNDLIVAKQVVEDDPNGEFAKIIMSGKDKRFESLFQTMKKDIAENV